MQLLCGQCGKTIEVNEAKAGPTVQCPKCGHSIPVPFFGGDDQQSGASAAKNDAGFLPQSAIKKQTSDSSSQKLDKPFIPSQQAAQKQAEPAKKDQSPAEEGFADQARKVSFQKIKVKCAACQKELSVGYRLAGKKARCPKCGKSIEIPFPQNVDKIELEVLKKAAAAETEVLTMTAEDYDGGEEPPSASAAAASTASAAPRTQEKPKTKAPVPWIKTPKARMTIITGVLGIAFVVGVLIVLSHLSQSDSDGKAPVNPEQTSTIRDYVSEVPRTTGAQPEPSTSHTPPVIPVKQPVKQPSKPALTLKGVKTDEFAGSTFLPAMPGMIYWQVSIEIKAGEETVRLSNYGPNISLKAASGNHPSLGSPLPGANLPIPAVQAKLDDIPPNAKLEVTVVFEVPRSVDKGMVEVSGVGACEAACPPPAAQEAKLDGRYGVMQYRHLRPAPKNGVMRALQDTQKQTVELKPAGDGYDFSIAEAGIKGKAKPSDKKGVFELVMTNGNETLENCQICLNGDGTLLTIFAAPGSRYDSLTYLREGAQLRKPPEFHQIGPARLQTDQPQKPKDSESKGNKSFFEH